MTAKEYLSRYHLINIRINQKIDQQRQLIELAQIFLRHPAEDIVLC